MKSGGLFTALGVLIVLGGLVWYTNKHPKTEAASKTPAAPKLMAVDAKLLEDIRIAKPGSDPIELAKLADKWEIVKPAPMPADQDAVGMLTGSLATLNADRVIDEHPASLDAFGLNSPALEVDVTVKGGKTTKVLIGGDTPAATGTYVKLDSDPKIYTLPTFTKASFDKSVNDLRDKRLLTFDQDKLTSVVLTGKGPAFEFGKNAQGEWQTTKPRPMRADSLQVDDFIRKLKDAKMDLAGTVDDKAAAAAYASGEKLGTVSTADNKGTQTLELHRAKDKAVYAKSTAVAGIYKVAGDVGDSLGKTVDDFRNKKLFDFAFNDPTKLEINGMTYQKSGDKWTSGSTAYEAGTVQTVIDKLRDLSATKFADKMAGAQTLAVGVTSGDNHRFEKVNFAKDANAYNAQRDGDPSVYVVDSSNVDDLQKAISGIKPQAAPQKK